MTKRYLSKEDLPYLNELLKGWNTIPDVTFYNRLIKKDKWNIEEYKAVKQMVADGARSATDVIFLVWNNHPCYKKYVGTEVMQPPPFTIEEFVKKASDNGIDYYIGEEDR